MLRCFEAGAVATGATLDIGGQRHPYAQLHHDPDIAAAYRRNAEALGRVFPDPTAPSRPGGSTDMGNVSLALPSIHPMIGIDSLPATNHQPEFAAHCVTPAADQALVHGALARPGLPSIWPRRPQSAIACSVSCPHESRSVVGPLAMRERS